MRFFADENVVELALVDGLRGLGHDVATVEVGRKGSIDSAILAGAAAEGRILLTNDKDFAELTFFRRQAAAGVVLIRLPDLRTAEKASQVLDVIEDLGQRLVGMMTVIEREATRRRPLPSVPPSLAS